MCFLISLRSGMSLSESDLGGDGLEVVMLQFLLVRLKAEKFFSKSNLSWGCVNVIKAIASNCFEFTRGAMMFIRVR